MSKSDLDNLRALVRCLGRAINCAADPHVDCRDEMVGHLADAEAVIEEWMEEVERGAE